MGLVEFLRARLDEDEAAARSCAGPHWCGCAHVDFVMTAGRCDCGYPARVLADVEAKRAFIEDANYVMRSYENDNAPDTYGGVSACDEMLKRLASVYAGHPDYDEAWRP